MTGKRLDSCSTMNKKGLTWWKRHLFCKLFTFWPLAAIYRPLISGGLPHTNRIRRNAAPEAVFVNLLKSPGIDSRPDGPVRQPYLSYRPAGGIESSESIPGLLKRLQIRAQGICRKLLCSTCIPPCRWVIHSLTVCTAQIVPFFRASNYE